MEKTLSKEISGIEITDELIAINKKYQKLGEIYDKYEALIDELSNNYTFGSSTGNSGEGNAGVENKKDEFLIEREKQIKVLEKMKDKIADQMSKIWEDTRKEIYLHRMLKGAMMLKAFKEVECEEKQTNLL